MTIIEIRRKKKVGVFILSNYKTYSNDTIILAGKSIDI